MKNILFPRDWLKLSDKKRDKLIEQKKKIESEYEYKKLILSGLKSEITSLDIVLKVNEKRDLIEKYWDSLTEYERTRNENNSEGRSPVTFKNFAHLDWKDLDDYEKGTVLACYCDADIEELNRFVQNHITV